MSSMLKDRWSRRLGLKAEDWRKLWLMGPVFLICGIAEALNYNGFMTLFNQRFGSAYMPYIYVAEAIVLPFEAWFMTWLAGRLSKPALMRAMYAIMTGIVLANAAMLLGLRITGEDLRWYYPILFLSSNFVVRQQTILLWSLAVDLCPTQQAKRLMPLFVGGATLGGMAAGLITQLISPWLGPDIVYVLGPAFLLAAAFNYRKAIAVYLVPLALKASKAADAETDSLSSMDYFRRTLRSPFLLSVLGLMLVMPALYFLMEFIFLNTAHTAYPDEAEFGRMFGVVTTILFALAFLLQLVSGKLMAWLGASSMLTAISAVYALAFVGAWTLLGSPVAMAAVAGGYMLTYLLIYYSAEPSYQLFYKILPLQQRDGFRYVAQGIATFAGILLGAGLQALHTGLGWGFPALAAVGTCGAVVLVALSWTVRQLYMKELVRSVHVLALTERDASESLQEILRNPRVMKTIHAMLRQDGADAKEVALHIIGHAPDAKFLPELLNLLDEDNAKVRTAALKAMNMSSADIGAMARVASLLEDPEQEVRAIVVHKIAQMKHMPAQAFFFLRMKLLDSEPMVVAEAVKAMYSLQSAQSYEACNEAVAQMLKAGGESAVHGCRVIAELRLDAFATDVEKLLDDSRPSVRVAATACLGLLGRAQVAKIVYGRLETADQELYRASISALADIGDRVIDLLRTKVEAAPPKTWQASVIVLSRLLPDADVRGWLSEQATAKLGELESSARMAAAFRVLGRADLAELATMRQRDLRTTVYGGCWGILERLTDDQVVTAIRTSIADADEETRSGGLEVLAEGIGERRLSQKLASALQADDDAHGAMTEEAAREAVEACKRSPDDWWREMAAEWAAGEERGTMQEEQGMLGRLKKVVFLKKVPFFADLTLEELGLIAAVATERRFGDGDKLLERGQANSEMYVVIDGNVELTSVSAAGWEGTLGVLAPGDVCGATSALDESASSVTAQAFFGEVHALAIEREEITRLVRLYPEIGIGLLRASLARVRLLEEMMMKIDS
ncbi:cyclic nucleotide-binding domain-containing protein [Cohnella sp. GCM10027633]|uniref:cyclic nucleotide-binding domain-containing protein n=1 Tax=unclassified Cohnella TaxID=2636738 RepID=UPI003642BFBD